jgi:exodeoxyribonuclease VII small subunit
VSRGKFEEAYEELEKIIKALETGAISLDESLEHYERGVKALKTCHGILDEAEKRIEILIRDSQGELRTEPFDAEGTS